MRAVEENVITTKYSVQLAKWGKSLSALAAFAPISDSLVVEVEPEVSVMTSVEFVRLALLLTK